MAHGSGKKPTRGKEGAGWPEKKRKQIKTFFGRLKTRHSQANQLEVTVENRRLHTLRRN